MTFLGYWDGKERWRGTGIDPRPGGMTWMSEASRSRYDYVRRQHALGFNLCMVNYEEMRDRV